MSEAIPLLPQSACVEWTRMSFFLTGTACNSCSVLQRKQDNGLSAYVTVVLSPHCDMFWDDNNNI